MANLGYIQVTRVCNQHCLFCSNPENNRMIELKDVEAQLATLLESGYYGVILTGGEPTLHPELEQIISLAAATSLQVRMITNGQRTAEDGFLESLIAAGLQHVHLSVHSARQQVQSMLTGNPDSWKNIHKTLEIIGNLEITCDINCVICAQNADHLDETVRKIVGEFPFVKHFVFNNIDSRMNRVEENPHTVARLADLELSLFRALSFLESTGRGFRVERLPLCYMTDFAHASTETRKIVKGEERTVHFLDDKGRVHQTEFFHEKAQVCKKCLLKDICAGLYDLGGAYDPTELHAVFIDPERVKKRILRK